MTVATLQCIRHSSFELRAFRRVDLLLDQTVEHPQRFDGGRQFAGDLLGGPGVGSPKVVGFVRHIVVGFY